MERRDFILMGLATSLAGCVPKIGARANDSPSDEKSVEAFNSLNLEVKSLHFSNLYGGRARIIPVTYRVPNPEDINDPHYQQQSSLHIIHNSEKTEEKGYCPSELMFSPYSIDKYHRELDVYIILSKQHPLDVGVFDLSTNNCKELMKRTKDSSVTMPEGYSLMIVRRETQPDKVLDALRCIENMIVDAGFHQMDITPFEIDVMRKELKDMGYFKK